jgi:hypothetical protein
MSDDDDRAPGTHWIGDWQGPRAGLDAVEYKKNHVPTGNRIPTIQPVAIPTELSRFLLWRLRALEIGTETETKQTATISIFSGAARKLDEAVKVFTVSESEPSISGHL